jgi:hypothetical protein
MYPHATQIHPHASFKRLPDMGAKRLSRAFGRDGMGRRGVHLPDTLAPNRLACLRFTPGFAIYGSGPRRPLLFRAAAPSLYGFGGLVCLLRLGVGAMHSGFLGFAMFVNSVHLALQGFDTGNRRRTFGGPRCDMIGHALGLVFRGIVGRAHLYLALDAPKRKRRHHAR